MGRRKIIPNRKDLTVSEKHEILRKFDALPKCSQRQAAIQLGLPQSSLSRILNQRHSIYTDLSSNCNAKRKRKRSGKDFVFGDELLRFYEDYKQQNGTVSRNVLVNRAEEIAKEFGLKDFKATDGWFSRWKQRNNIVLNKEKDREYALDAQRWTRENVPAILENYAPDKIFNSDITEIGIRAYANYITKTKDAYFEKVSILLTCNMIGDKRTPLIIGKSEYQGCFKEIKTLPVQYVDSEDASMTRQIFIDHLLAWNKELGSEQIVLILDCSFEHFKNLMLQNIKMIFLPSNVMSLNHPLEQGIFKTFKSLYKKDLNMKIDDTLSSTKKSSAEEVLKELSLLDSIHLITNAWLSVPAACINTSFKKAGFCHQRNHQNTVVERPNEEVEPKLYITPDISETNLSAPNISPCDVVETNLSVPEEADMNASSEEMYTDVSEKSDDDVKDNSRLSIEMNNIEEKIVHDNSSDKETINALSVIQKTLEQRGASVDCFELFYKMENEVYKLLKKSVST